MIRPVSTGLRVPGAFDAPRQSTDSWPLPTAGSRPAATGRGKVGRRPIPQGRAAPFRRPVVAGILCRLWSGVVASRAVRWAADQESAGSPQLDRFGHHPPTASRCESAAQRADSATSMINRTPRYRYRRTGRLARRPPPDLRLQVRRRSPILSRRSQHGAHCRLDRPSRRRQDQRRRGRRRRRHVTAASADPYPDLA